MDQTTQVKRIIEAGCQPEDWLVYINMLVKDTQLSNITNRYRLLCSAYNNALKLIDLEKNNKNPAYAQICINFAKLKMTHDFDDARVVFKYARANIKTLAIVHVEAAQLELTRGDKDKCLDILKKAQNLKCEPTQMVETAMERFTKGLSSLQADNEFTIPFSDHTKEQNTSESRSFYTGMSVTQSASKIKRLNTLSTPDCKSLPAPVSASVGASARGKIRPNYGLPQRVKRRVLQVTEVPSSNPDDSDDDYPLSDIKPLEKTTPPISDNLKIERLASIVESPKVDSSDSGVAMMETPSVEKPHLPSNNFSLDTPMQKSLPSQIVHPRTDIEQFHKSGRGVSQETEELQQNGSVKSESLKPQSLFNPSSNGTVQPPSTNGIVQPQHRQAPPVANGSCHQPQPISVIPQNCVPQYNQMNPAMMPVQTVQRKDVITVNKINYRILRIVGKGGSSKVYQVFSESKKKVLAIKYVTLECADQMTIQGYMNEVTLLQKLRKSANIIHLYDYEITDSHIYLVMECGSIDLASFLSTKKINAQDMKFYWRGMLDAVDVVHQAGIVHSDLKPANFLFVEGALKLIDFGIANAIQTDKTSVIRESQIGTLNYMSPEAIQDVSATPSAGGQRRPKLKINCKSDVWSLGCIFYYMVYGKTPFQHITFSLMKLQAICDPRHVLEFPAVDNPHLLDLLKKCLLRDSRERPSIQELKKHPYFQADPPPPPEPSQPNVPNLTEEHLKSLISQLHVSHAQLNSPTSISAVSRTLMEQLQSGQQLDISTALRHKPRNYQPVLQQHPPKPPPPLPIQSHPALRSQPSHLPAQSRPQVNRMPLQIVQMEEIQHAQSALQPLCSSKNIKYMKQESQEKENRDLESVLRSQLANKYQNAIPVQNTEEQTYEQTWGTETLK
ncbi:dual specificity protein kinase TTK-like isoform X1 [Asterias amurensis]|uniref:dual specificity protein kinase TTK-like isoform X1 n=1 Tax=Asterias amurensis TaxID=7602 RepID=UPI003AB56706